MNLDSAIPGAPNFSWGEFLYLPSVGFHAHPGKMTEYKNIIATAQKMQKIREILGNDPIRITSGWRPDFYNQLIKGAVSSAHILGLACDFIHKYYEAREVREILEPKLEELKIRMERDSFDKMDWVHIDLKPPLSIGSRYFVP